MSSHSFVPTAVSAERFRAAPFVLVGALLLWIGLLLYSGSGALFSEDWVHLGIAHGQSSLGEAFDLQRVPMRPLQHVVFYLFASMSELDPVVARGVGLLGHLLALVCVYVLGRSWGGSARAATFSVALFALAPNVSSVLSPAALGWPWRVAFSLLALALFERSLTRESLPVRSAALWAAIGAWVLALGCHQGALIVPGIAVLRLFFLSEPDVRWRAIFRPGIVLWCALAVGYVAYLQFFRDATGHGMKELASLPANFVRAELSLFPEPLRLLAVGGLRAGAGVPLAVGGTICVGAFLVLARIFITGSGVARFALLAIGLELLLPVLTTGFASRYAYLAFAIAALGLGIAAARAHAWGNAQFFAGVIALLWAMDLGQECHEFRGATQAASAVLEVAREQQVQGGAFALVDVPERWGREEEMQFFGLGLPKALELTHGGSSGIVLRTWDNFHTTDVPFVPYEDLEQRAAAGEFRLLAWDPVQLRLVAR